MKYAFRASFKMTYNNLLPGGFMQRFFDLLFSSLAILFFLPLLIPIMIVLRLTGEGEVFFRQERVGRHRTSFSLLKFATMLKNSEQMGAGTITLKDDFRVLPFGAFLRKTKLNELPQLFNIFLGDMSVIGPRPLHIKQFSFYSTDDQRVIASTLPGLSGMGSIIFRDEEKILQNSGDPDKTYKDLITPEKARLEKWYVENNSLFLYFKLIFFTIVAVIFSNLNMRKFFNEL
jgi:lipopolysaccharide/colanic/teichoic acid biosynthesis glycosyltransferase